MIKKIINTVEQSDAVNIDLNATGFLPSIAGIVYTTGDQTISGVKTFKSRPTVNGTGVFLSGDLGYLPSTYITGYVPVSVTQANDAEAQTIDIVSDNVRLTRGDYGVLYNPLYQSQGVDNPSYTQWNEDGWDDLSNVTTRTYKNLNRIGGINNFGNVIVGNELVMHDTSTNKYHKVLFSAWQQNAGENPNYRGFSYTRSEIGYSRQEVSGLVDFTTRPTVNGTGVLISGDLINIDTSNFYTNDNPSGFTTADQLATGLSGVVQVAIGYSLLSANTAVNALSGYLDLNPSGFITGVNLSAYALNANTGSFITTARTGAFYAASNPSGFITGVSNFTYISGDLTGNLLSPTVTKIQGNAVSSQTPADGQTLQWNGTSWVPGAIPAGGNGGGGVVYYFNFSNTSGIAPTGGLPTTGGFPISLLGRNYDIGSGSAQSTDLEPQGAYKLLCGFVSASGDAGITNIPAGLWDFNIWASVNSNNAEQSSIRTVLNIYNPSNSTYRKVAESDDVFLYDMDTPTQYITNITVPQTGILATERLYIEVYGKKYTSSSRRITLYFDSYRPSHVHTTIPSVAGNGVVKVINGVFQSPATGIFNSDIDNNANIAQSKIANLTTDLANLYPRTNPSGFIPTVNGTGVSNGGNVITGNYSVSSIVSLTQTQYNAITPVSGVLYIIT